MRKKISRMVKMRKMIEWRGGGGVLRKHLGIE
jgi:hypothetical protein